MSIRDGIVLGLELGLKIKEAGRENKEVRKSIKCS
jgi:hypothetical protein